MMERYNYAEANRRKDVPFPSVMDMQCCNHFVGISNNPCLHNEDTKIKLMFWRNVYYYTT